MPRGRLETTVTATPPTPDIEPADSYPVVTTKSLLAIEHPAILSSVDAGVKSLGGLSALTKVPSTVFQ